jgi:hypothetical protein
MLKGCKVIKHTISIEYSCQKNPETKHTVKIVNPSISSGQYFDDWEFTAISFKCEFCGKEHIFEI